MIHDDINQCIITWSQSYPKELHYLNTIELCEAIDAVFINHGIPINEDLHRSLSCLIFVLQSVYLYDKNYIKIIHLFILRYTNIS
jgi:hypothetical protein